MVPDPLSAPDTVPCVGPVTVPGCVLSNVEVYTFVEPSLDGNDTRMFSDSSENCFPRRTAPNNRSSFRTNSARNTPSFSLYPLYTTTPFDQPPEGKQESLTDSHGANPSRYTHFPVPRVDLLRTSTHALSKVYLHTTPVVVLRLVPYPGTVADPLQGYSTAPTLTPSRSGGAYPLSLSV